MSAWFKQERLHLQLLLSSDSATGLPRLFNLDSLLLGEAESALRPACTVQHSSLLPERIPTPRYIHRMSSVSYFGLSLCELLRL